MRPLLSSSLSIALVLTLGASVTACAGQSQATKKHLADLEDTVTRLQNGQDRLEERLVALELNSRQHHQKKESASASEPSDPARPELAVVKLAPGGSQDAEAPGRGEIDMPPADPPPESDDGPRPVLRASGHEQGRIEERQGKKSRAKQTAEAAKQYKAALGLVRGKQYGPALHALAAFVKQHPDHPYADNALYWSGECYYAQGKYKQAAQTFRDLLHRYPAGNKVPDALLKLGMTEAQLGREHEARASFALLSQNYPSASAAQRIPQGYREP
jgi:tol-pal system protein YbgF